MRIISSLVVTVSLAGAAQAQVSPAVKDLSDALGVPEVLDVMRTEGLQTAAGMSESFLGGPSRSWDRAASEIYDTDAMQEAVLAGMAEGLDGEDPSPITAFFESELGVKVIGLEISARQAFLDEGVEEASEQYVEELQDEDPDRYALLTDFIEVNDLIESNVIGAMNSNYAFLTALRDTGGFEAEVSDQEILQQVWSQEGELREDTTKWLYAYLSLAYQPLSDEELAIYLDFSTTRYGELLNKVLFAGFDPMFIEISRQMGLKLGELSSASEL